MDRYEAKKRLGLESNPDPLTEPLIRRAFYAKVRTYHPDSPDFIGSKEMAGCKIKELIEARQYLLEFVYDPTTGVDGVGSIKTTEQDVQEMMDIVRDMWKDGTFHDSFPSGRVISWLIESPTVNTALDSLYTFTQSKRY